MTSTAETPPVASTSASASSRPAISKRVQKLLQTSSYRNSETLMALETLASYDLLDAPSSSGHAGPSTARTWTGSAASTALRRSVEKRLGAGSREFLGTFGQVNADLDDLQSHLKAMHDCCDHVGERLHAAHADAQPLLQQADSLKKQRADIGIQQQVISAFLARFTLSPEQLQTLSSPNSTIGPPLFDVIDHLHQIREHCQLLLAAAAQDESPASHRPNAGLEIMSSTSKQLDVAYTKLQKFAAFQVRGYTRPEVEVSPVMRQVVQHLKARPQALDAVLDTLTTNRSSALLSHFVDALTRGGPNGIPRPIELHAHDPIRYVGDMLAWIHQLMAAEREFLDSFFSVQASSRFPGAPRQDFVHERSSSVSDESVSDESRICQLMDKDLEGCGRPLKLRVGQTVKSQEGSLMAYRISNLVLFYKHTIERTVGVEALMSRVLSDIATQATGAFYEILDAAARSYMRFVQPPPSDLSSPAMFVDALSNLKEVMDVYQATLMDSKQPEGGSTTEDIDAFEPVLHKALDPALKMCDQMAELTPRTWDRNVFLLNCRADAKTTLDPYEEFTAQRSDALQMEMNEKGEALASEHYESLLKESGLEPLMEALHTRKPDELLARIPSSSATALSASLRTFDAFLTTSVLSTSPKLGLVSSPRLASQIHQSALIRLSAAYAQVYDAVMSGKEGYEFGVTRMRRTKEEVQMLLGLT